MDGSVALDATGRIGPSPRAAQHGCVPVGSLVAPATVPLRWRLSDKYDPAARALAERHYTRQKPGAAQFLRPGFNYTLVTEDGLAVWNTWRGHAQHFWHGAWENTLFRNEGAGLSSDLILEALAATRAAWGDPPAIGTITMIDVDAVRHKRDPGRCYRRAGFVPVGWTSKRHRLVLRLYPELHPQSRAALWTCEVLGACAP